MDSYISLILTYLQQNYLREGLSFLLGFSILGGYFFLKKSVKRYISSLEKIGKHHYFLDIFIRLLYLFLAFLLFFYVEKEFKSYISGALFKNAFLFLTFVESVKFLSKVSRLKNKAIVKLIVLLIGIDIGIIFFLDIAHNLNLPLGQKYRLDIVVKLLAIVPFFVFSYTLSIKALELVKIESKAARLFFIKFIYIFDILIAVIGYFWLIDLIQLNVKFLIGLILFFISTLVYIFLLIFINEQLQTKFEVLSQHFPELKGRLYTIITLAYVFVLYFIFTYLFQIEPIIETLKNIYIVKTEVLSISLYSLIRSILFFILVINLILLIRIFLRYLSYKKTGDFEPSPVEAVIYNFGVLLAAIISLSMLGITWKVLLPLIGALGIGAGFGLQSIINNYISGFVIIFNRKVEVGDIVELPGYAGKFAGNNQDVIFGIVTDIGVINTVIETVDGVSVAVPNSRFVSENIINYTLSDNLVRIRIPFKIPYDAEREKVEKILIETANEFKRFLAKYYTPQVWFFDIKDYYNEYVLVLWIDARNWKKIIWLRSEIYKKAAEKLKKAGIKFPVITIELRGEIPQTKVN